MNHRSTARIAAVMVALAAPATGQQPQFSPTGPDAASYGEAAGYPMGTAGNYWHVGHLVATHSGMDRLFQHRVVRAPAAPSALKRAASFDFTYEWNRQASNISDYLSRNPATGLLIAQGDTILLERYQYGRTDRDRFTSFSMAKTVTAMLIGLALADGAIKSLDDPASRYVKELAGTAYGETSISNLLQMASGVRFREDYDGTDDISKLARGTFGGMGPGGPSVLAGFNDRLRPAGEKFVYASSETQALGLVLRAAVGKPVGEYLQERIWGPMGAEADATWLMDRSGMEATYCCLNAVLRDYARLGLMMAHGGRWNGRQILPAAWVEEMTRPHSEQMRPRVATPYNGYGYQTWLMPEAPGRFAFLGVRGQSIFVDTRTKIVMVITAVRRQPVGGRAEDYELFRALTRKLPPR